MRAVPPRELALKHRILASRISILLEIQGGVVMKKWQARIASSLVKLALP
jgi:hypothetical protein